MTPDRWERARALFHAALELPLADADAYLRAECATDTAMLSEVRGMLEEHRLTGVLDQPPWELMAPPDTAPQSVFSPGQLVAGRYRILRYLNRGGMGEVYEAEHPLLPDHVALKTLLPSIASDQSMIERFKQEIHLARRIAHPNVCKVFELEWHQPPGTAAAIYFLTMEFLEGETLSRRIQRSGRMSCAEALPLLEQMADALSAAHRAGVIHRDFKTSNVMLVPAPAGLRAVVTDFGLARGVAAPGEDTVTLTHNLAGTLDYMAPELFAGAAASSRSDLYAFGVVVYKMITGALPFAGEAPFAAAMLRARSVPSPRTLIPGLDEKWERALLRALDPDPGARFVDVREFPQALRGEPVSAPPAAATPPLSRRKLLTGACALAALAAGWFGWQSWSHSRNRPGPEAARLYQQGVDNVHAGAYFAATKALAQTVEVAPAFSPARARLAESWLELDLPERALREFAPIHRQDNSALSDLEQLQIQAIDLTITREFADALARYEQMRKLAPASATDLDVDLGRAYEKAGKPDQAIEAYRRAAHGSSHNAAAWLRLGVLLSRQKKQADSDAAFVESERRYQQSSNLEGLTELALQRGVAANRIDRFDDAAALLLKASELAHQAGNVQQEISARLTLANVSYKSGKTERAEALAREALAAAQANQLESLTIRGFINLGGSYLVKGDFAGAEQRFQEALALAQRSNSSRLAAQTRLNLASVYDRLQRPRDQIQSATEALSYFQSNRWVQETFLALLLIGRGEQYQGNLDQALASFQSLLDQSTKARDRPNIALAHEALGNVLSAQENFPQSLRHFQDFLAASPDGLRAGYAASQCAITLARLGRSPEAEAMFAKAAGAARDNADLRVSVARYRAESALLRGQSKEAIDHCRKAVADNPRLMPQAQAAFTEITGLALLRSGNLKAGLENCQAAFNAQSTSDPGMLVYKRLSLLEALVALRDSARAAAVFHDLEPALPTHPELRWRALALIARTDPQYAARARTAIGQLQALWGREAFLLYRKRPDVQALSRHLSLPDSANQ